MSTPLRTPILAALLGGLVLSLPIARAEPERPASHKDELRRRPHGPPAEAFEACNAHEEGDACTVAFHDRALAGSCLQARDGEALFCMPHDLPPPRD